MTKTVFTGHEVPHIFAADHNATARNSNGTLWCENGKLYSYQQPIAAFVAGKMIVSDDRFSVTTTKHQSWTYWALNHIETVTVPSLKSLLGCITDVAYAEWIAKRVKTIEALQESTKRMRADHKKQSAMNEIASLESACAFVWCHLAGKKSDWQASQKTKDKADKQAAIRRYTTSRNRLESGVETAQHMIERARDLMTSDLESGRTHGLQAWWRLDNTMADIRRIDEMSAFRGSATFDHATKLMGKKWAKECNILAAAIYAIADALQPEIDSLRVEYDRMERLSNAEKIERWIAGENVSIGINDTICRVKGDIVETSRGARVPLDQAVQFAALAKVCRDAGKPLDLKGRKIGQYHGNSIDAQGNLTVRCHHIKWEAIADCLARYEAGKAV